MGRHELSLKTLDCVGGGKLDAAWCRLVRQATDDCHDRPADGGKRKVTLTLVMTPVPEGDVCDKVTTEFELTANVPKYHTHAYSMGIQQRANQKSLVFNDEAVDNSDQLDLFEADPVE